MSCCYSIVYDADFADYLASSLNLYLWVASLSTFLLKLAILTSGPICVVLNATITIFGNPVYNTFIVTAMYATLVASISAWFAKVTKNENAEKIEKIKTDGKALAAELRERAATFEERTRALEIKDQELATELYTKTQALRTIAHKLACETEKMKHAMHLKNVALEAKDRELEIKTQALDEQNKNLKNEIIDLQRSIIGLKNIDPLDHFARSEAARISRGSNGSIHI